MKNAFLRLTLNSFVAVAVVVVVSTSGFSQKPKASKTPAKPTAATTPVSAAKCTGANGLTAGEVTELLAGQNRMRAEHKLAPFTWDCTLANAAQEWANKGVFAHREDTNYGENMFVASSPAEPVGSAISRWMSEQPNWTNKTGTCAAGKICNHYTQVVWKNSKKVGCGINRNGTVKWKLMIVCNYDPAGNQAGPAY